MKPSIFLSIGSVSLAFLASQAAAQTTAPSEPAKATAEADTPRLSDIPAATEAEKKAMRESMQIAILEGAEFAFLNQELAKDPNAFIKKLLDLQLDITNNMLEGELKDQFPAFYKQYLLKTKELCQESIDTLSKIENIMASPEFMALQAKNKQATAIYDDYFKREIGIDSQQYGFAEGQKLGAILSNISQHPDDYPSLVKLNKEAEGASTPEEAKRRNTAYRAEIFRLAVDQYRKNQAEAPSN